VGPDGRDSHNPRSLRAGGLPGLLSDPVPLVAADLQERYLSIALTGLALNIGLNLILIPRIGVLGAAIATVVTEAVVTLGAASALFWKP